jgi:hypothetical protein
MKIFTTEVTEAGRGSQRFSKAWKNGAGIFQALEKTCDLCG